MLSSAPMLMGLASIMGFRAGPLGLHFADTGLRGEFVCILQRTASEARLS